MHNSQSFNKKLSQYKKNFYNLYHSKIIHIFRRYETFRKEQILELLIFWAIGGVVFVVLLNCFMHLSDPNVFEFFFLLISVIGIPLGLIYLPYHYNKKFIAKLKKECMPLILPLFGNISWLDDVSMIPDEEIFNSMLFSGYNRRNNDDGFIGSYSNVKFMISETHLELVTRSGKHSSVTNIFKGVVFLFEFNKIVNNKTIIATKGDSNIGVRCTYMSVFGLIFYLVLHVYYESFMHGYDFKMSLIIFLLGLILIFIISGLTGLVNRPKEALDELKLEDTEFNKKYKAYSSDQVEGRYLITPAFMERFKNIQTAFGTNKVKCSFYNGNLMFAISTDKNLFEIGSLFHSLENPKQLESFFNELTSIFMLIDYFKLNEKTGL